MEHTTEPADGIKPPDPGLPYFCGVAALPEEVVYLDIARQAAYFRQMSLSDLLPAVHSLPPPDKLRLIHILADDLAAAAKPAQLSGDLPIWSPYNAFPAAEALLSALESDPHQENPRA